MKQECIEFSIYGDYEEYIKSHLWKIEHTGGNGILEVCEKCGTAMQNPGGTINFRFGCSYPKFQEIEK